MIEETYLKVEGNFCSVWTVDGKIMFKNSDNGKPNLYYG